jgi:hypothetical protein
MPTREEIHSSPPRTHGTPSGYRNVRVLVTQDLHFQLLSYSSQSHLSLPALVVAWLSLATPLTPPSSGPQGQPRPDEPTPGHRLSPTPEGDSSEAVRPGEAPLPKSLAVTRPDQTTDPSLSGSLPSTDPVKSPSAQNHHESETERTRLR